MRGNRFFVVSGDRAVHSQNPLGVVRSLSAFIYGDLTRRLDMILDGPVSVGNSVGSGLE